MRCGDVLLGTVMAGQAGKRNINVCGLGNSYRRIRIAKKLKISCLPCIFSLYLYTRRQLCVAEVTGWPVCQASFREAVSLFSGASAEVG